MPTFVDFHDDLKLPDEAVRQITKETEEHKVDKFGVRQVELFHNPDGKVYAYSRHLTRKRSVCTMRL
jgi:hypothetical protein